MTALASNPVTAAEHPLGEFASLQKVNVLPGHFYVTSKPEEVITTLLGSCVAACVRDPATGLGGLNHFLLPGGGDNVDDKATRYGDSAMNALIGTLIRQGARRDNLEIKIFGGANLFPLSSGRTVGDSNQKFILDFINNEGLILVSKHLGGCHGRRIYYHPETGKVKMQLMNNSRAEEIQKMEEELLRKAQNIDAADKGGDIELF